MEKLEASVKNINNVLKKGGNLKNAKKAKLSIATSRLDKLGNSLSDFQASTNLSLTSLQMGLAERSVPAVPLPNQSMIWVASSSSSSEARLARLEVGLQNLTSLMAAQATQLKLLLDAAASITDYSETTPVSSQRRGSTTFSSVAMPGSHNSKMANNSMASSTVITLLSISISGSTPVNYTTELGSKTVTSVEMCILFSARE